jgi:hypothetical protein
MAIPPTDPIANDLAIRLFLFGLAAMSFYEALKLERPRSYIAWLAFVLFAAAGCALTPISSAWPIGVGWLGELVSSPVPWFVLVVAVYLILRPRWAPPATADVCPSLESASELDISLNQLRLRVDGATSSLPPIMAAIKALSPAADLIRLFAHREYLQCRVVELDQMIMGIRERFTTLLSLRGSSTDSMSTRETKHSLFSWTRLEFRSTCRAIPIMI